MKKVALVLGVALLTGCGFFPNGAHASEAKGKTFPFVYERANANHVSTNPHDIFPGSFGYDSGYLGSDLGKPVLQHAQSAHRHHQQIAVMPVAVKMSGYGITFRLEPDNIGYIDDKVAAVEEDNEVATVYAVGLNMVIWYKHKHKAALVDHSGRFVGWLQ